MTDAATLDDASRDEQTNTPDEIIDNRGRGCANGIARVQRALTDLPDGAMLLIRSTDRRAKHEYPDLCRQTPHELIEIDAERTGLLRKEYRVRLRVSAETTPNKEKSSNV